MVLSGNFLSLAGTLAWAYTRDRDFVQCIEKKPQRDCSIELDIIITATARDLKNVKYSDFREVWPAIRRLIADERLTAEGKSVVCSGLSPAVATHLPNAPIPSGDADRLIILSGISLGPQDYLGPDEIYRFNGQGRYWYDVRFRVDEIVREFPALDIGVASNDDAHSVDLIKSPRGPGQKAVHNVWSELFPRGAPSDRADRDELILQRLKQNPKRTAVNPKTIDRYIKWRKDNNLDT